MASGNRVIHLSENPIHLSRWFVRYWDERKMTLWRTGYVEAYRDKWIPCICYTIRKSALVPKSLVPIASHAYIQFRCVYRDK
jgi:hypothetical protein